MTPIEASKLAEQISQLICDLGNSEPDPQRRARFNALWDWIHMMKPYLSAHGSYEDYARWHEEFWRKYRLEKYGDPR